MSEVPLKNKAVKGVAWSAIENFSNLGISFLFSVFLARILTPEDYGITALIAVFIAIGQCFINSGFSNALIRKQDRTEVDNSTAFYFNIVVGFVCFGLLYLVAPLIADFYDMPVLVSICRAMGISFIFNSLCVVQQALLTVAIDFRTQAKVSLSSNVLSGAIALYFAHQGVGVWALVVQSVLGSVIRTVLLWILAKWRPKASFSWSSFKELFSFGSRLLASGLLDTIWNNVYPIIIGKLFTPASLGMYSRAHGYANLPSANVTGIIQRVTFPVLSEMQDDDQRLAVNYRRMLRLSAFIIFPLMMLLAGIADPLIRWMITDKWAGCIVLLQIICFSMMWYPVHAINLNLLQVKGRSDLFLRLEIIKKVVGISVLCVSYRWGVEGMCMGSVCTSIIALVINTYYTGKLINVGFFKQMGDLFPIVVKSLACGALALGCTYIPTDYNIAKLLCGVIVFAVAYLGTNFITHNPELLELLNIIRRK